MAINISDPPRLVTVVWYVTIFFAFIFSICAIAFAAQNDDGDSSDAGAIGFAGVWTMLLAIFLAIGGTFVLRKFKTPLAIGFLIGVVTIMSLNMIVLCALLDQEGTNCRDLNDRLDDGIDTCQAIGCQKAFYDPDAIGDNPTMNRYLVCCQTMQAVKYGDQVNVYYYNFGGGHPYTVNEDGTAADGSEFTVSSLTCPECDGGECDGSVAAATFAAFLFIAYAAFAIVLGYYRADIIVSSSDAGDDEESSGKVEETAVAYPVDNQDIELAEKSLDE